MSTTNLSENLTFVPRETMHRSLLQSKYLDATDNVTEVFLSLTENYMTALEIADASGVSKNAVSASLQSLVKKGLVYKSIRNNAFKLSQRGSYVMRNYQK